MSIGLTTLKPKESFFSSLTRRSSSTSFGITPINFPRNNGEYSMRKTLTGQTISAIGDFTLYHPVYP